MRRVYFAMVALVLLLISSGCQPLHDSGGTVGVATATSPSAPQVESGPPTAESGPATPASGSEPAGGSSDSSTGAAAAATAAPPPASSPAVAAVGSGSAPGALAPVVVAAGPVPARASAGVTKHPVVWQQKSPGYPLVSDDPAAKGQKVAMLTFDDGPGPGTAAILDALAAAHVKALFFLTGSAFKHMDLVEREYREGHKLGVHTMNHPNLTKLTPAQMRPEIEPLVNLIQQVTGAKPRYLRPPYGSWNKDVAAVADEYHLQIINWTDGSLDWDGLDAKGWKDPKLVADAVMKLLGRGAIILMHDTKTHTAQALPEVIRRVREAGYEFVTLP